MQIGTAFFQNGRYPQALQEFLLAEELDPDHPAIQNNLALSYFVREKFELALKHINRAIELKQNYTEAYNNRSRILIELGRFAEAIKDADVVVADLTYPQPVRGLNNKALALFRQGSFNESRQLAIKAVQLDRKSCLSQILLGRSELELDDIKAAARSLDRAIEVCGDDTLDEAAYFAGLAHFKLGAQEKAIARLEKIIKTSPNGQFAKKAKSLLEIMR